MRIRLSLTLDVERSRRPEPPERESDLAALVEHAPPRPIGFTAEPGALTPLEDHR